MIEILNKFFLRSKNLGNLNIGFQELRKKTEIELLFRAVESYSDESEIRYVGGCVRKILKNEKVNDIDLATNLNPEQIIQVCKKKNIKFYETGLEHGTITAIINDYKFEITSLRKDIKTDGRHADVIFTNDWKEDASRRDFSINSNNDLEKAAFKLNPKLKNIKLFLSNLPNAMCVRMTGSGSCLVAYYQSKKKALKGLGLFKKKYKNYWCIVSKTV